MRKPRFGAVKTLAQAPTANKWQGGDGTQTAEPWTSSQGREVKKDSWVQSSALQVPGTGMGRRGPQPQPLVLLSSSIHNFLNIPYFSLLLKYHDVCPD